MNVDGKNLRSIWVDQNDDRKIQIIDQRKLPFELIVEDLSSVEDVAAAIKDMHVRGAPLIGVAAAYGMYFACLEAPDNDEFNKHLLKAAEELKATRPTAINLKWAVDQQIKEISKGSDKDNKVAIAQGTANRIAEEDIKCCKLIGEHGLKIFQELNAKKNGDTINILTHCNAGWLACVDYGTATSAIYQAHDLGMNLHVWVDETRPRNQGARLTAWEFEKHGIPYTIISDNTGGHLMQQRLVDLVMVGSDRTTYTGDVANKIGTYLKALAAKDNNVPFYAALPSSSIDWEIKDGVKDIPIEQRNSEEVKYIEGMSNGSVKKVLLSPEASPAANYSFDVTPSRLVTGIITERGISEANEEGIIGLFPEKRV